MLCPASLALYPRPRLTPRARYISTADEEEVSEVDEEEDEENEEDDEEEDGDDEEDDGGKKSDANGVKGKTSFLPRILPGQ